MRGIRWRSWLGAATLFFLLYGGANFVGAISVAIGLVAGGADADTLVLSPRDDAYLVGGKQVISALRQENPKFDALLVSSTVAFCSQMTVYAILVVCVAWFAIRRGKFWGVWAVAVAALAQIPYYLVIEKMYSDQGAFEPACCHPFYSVLLHPPFYLSLLARNLIVLALIGFVLAMIGQWRLARAPAPISGRPA